MDDYVEKALRTESMLSDGRKRYQMERLIHAGLGLGTEVGEFQDALKRHLFYGIPIDRTNLIEELGDILWYVALAADVLRVNINEIQQRNIAKLKKRYPEKFEDTLALNRDLEKERETLENK